MGAHGQFTAFERVSIAAAGLRHSRAPFPPERDCAESQSQISTREDFVFIAREQQRARVPWPDAAKCYSLSPRERAGVRGKCTQHSHASQFLRFVSPPLVRLPRGEGNK